MFIEYRPTKYVANPKQRLLGIIYCRATNGNQKLSKDLRSMFVDSINVFNCRISEVFIEYRPTEYIARTVRNKCYFE